MGHVEDRWTVQGPQGQRVRGPRHGRGKRWRARWLDPAGVWRSQAFTSKDEAAAFLARTDVEVRAGTYIAPDAGMVTVGEYGTRWLASKARLKEKTRVWYGGLLDGHVGPRWAHVPVGKVTRAGVTEWLATLSVSPSRARACYVALRGILDLAVDDRAIPANPALGVRLPRADRREQKPLTVEQVHELADVAEHQVTGSRLMVLVLAYTGLRWGELVGLDVGDVAGRRITVSRSVTEVSGRQVTGTPKSHQAREVMMPAFLGGEITDAIGERQVGPLFPAPRGGRWFHRSWHRSVWGPAVEAMAIDGLRVHDLRHTAASLAIGAGADVKVLQRMLGHASAAMTMDVYGDLLDDRLEQVADALDALSVKARAPKGPPRARLRAVQ